MGSLSHAPNDVIYKGCFIRVQVVSHDVLVPVPCRHMEYEKVWSMLLLSIHFEVLQLLVEERHAYTVSSSHVKSHHPISHKLPFVDAAGDICFLHHPQVNAVLGHPAEGRLQASTAPNLDAVTYEPYHQHFFGLLTHLYASPLGLSIVPHKPYQWCSFPLSLYLPRSSRPLFPSCPHYSVLTTSNAENMPASSI